MGIGLLVLFVDYQCPFPYFAVCVKRCVELNIWYGKATLLHTLYTYPVSQHDLNTHPTSRILISTEKNNTSEISYKFKHIILYE